MVTIKQIAERVGISPSTVSIVLGGKAAQRKISVETQQRILHAAAELGYRPNIAARSLRGGAGAEELQVAVFWAQDFRTPMMVRFLQGLRAEMERHDRAVRLVIYPYTNDSLGELPALTSATCHGALICNASYADMSFLADASLPIPTVLYNRMCAGYPSVNVDDAHMGALAARAFADQGCRRALVLTSPPVFEGMEIRVQGFMLEGRAHGLALTGTIYCDNSIRGGYAAMKRLLRAPAEANGPDALFCGSSMIAHGVLRALWESGQKPADWPKVIAIGNGGEDEDAYLTPSLSVVQLPMEQMAATCLRLLLARLSGKSTGAESHMLPVQYIPRETCGPIRLEESGGV